MTTADQTLRAASGRAHPGFGRGTTLPRPTREPAPAPVGLTAPPVPRALSPVGAATGGSDTWWPLVRAMLVATDLAALSLALLAASVARAGLLADWRGPTPSVRELAILVAAWLWAMASAGAYTARVLGTGAEEYKRVVQGTLRAFGAVAVLSYALDLQPSRALMAAALPVGLLVVPAGRYLARRAVVGARGRGQWAHRVVIVGDRAPVEQLVTRLREEPFAGFAPVGACLGDGSSRRLAPGVPVLGSWAQVAEIVGRVGADVVMVAGGPSATADRIREMAWSLEATGADLVVSTSLTDVTGPRISVRPVAGLPLLYVDQPRLTGLRRVVKAALDVVGAGLGLTLLSPLLLVTAAAVRLTSPGPAIFRQTRIGMDGREFRVYKFRTMYADAEERLAGLVAQNESDGLLFKIRDDPRVTPIGRVLRATSLDELPQLVNVLRGQMSLVGPRPLPVKDSDFRGAVRRRLLVRPGITGLWQVSGRSDIAWEESVRLDLNYVENWSLSLDLLILARTLAAIVRRQGAY